MHVNTKMKLFHELGEGEIEGSTGRGEFKYDIIDTF
jgi:hypothetical protein